MMDELNYPADQTVDIQALLAAKAAAAANPAPPDPLEALPQSLQPKATDSEELAKLRAKIREQAQAQLNSQQKWQDDLKQVMSNPQGLPNGLPMGSPSSPYDQHALRLLEQKMLQLIEHGMTGQNLINEFRGRHPELCSFEPYIEIEVQQAIRELESQGKKVDFRTALEMGIRSFRQKMAAFQQQAQGLGKAREAMRLDLAVASQPVSAPPKDVSKMTREEFAAYREQLKQERYKHY